MPVEPGCLAGAFPGEYFNSSSLSVRPLETAKRSGWSVCPDAAETAGALLVVFALSFYFLQARSKNRAEMRAP